MRQPQLRVPLLRCLAVLILMLGAVMSHAADDLLLYGRTNVGSRSAEAINEIDEEQRLSTTFVTPHTEWARPYARGTVRMLFFAQTTGEDTLAREGVELLERFDLTADAVYGDFHNTNPRWNFWLGGTTGEARMLRLLRQRYDVIVFMHISPQRLPPAARQQLADALAGGTGLVLVGATDDPLPSVNGSAQGGVSSHYPPFFTPTARLATVPAFLLGIQRLAAYNVGTSRVVVLPPRPDISYHRGWEADYDYWQDQLGRALLWAAGREPQTDLTLSSTPQPVRWAQTPAATVAASWRHAPVKDTVLTLSVRLQDGSRLPVAESPVTAAAGSKVWPLPSLPAGNHHLELFLRGPHGTESWAVAPLCAQAAQTIHLTLEKGWGEVNDQLNGVVQRNGVPLPHEQMVVQLLDRRGRILAQHDVGPSLRFAFPLAAWMPMLLTVKAALQSDTREVVSSEQYFNLTQRHHGQFNMVMWDYPVDTLSAYALEAMTREGVSGLLCHGTPGPEVAAYNLAWVPYTTRILNPLTTAGLAVNGCWNDLAIQQPYLHALAKTNLPAREHGVFVYSLGDEGALAGSSLDATSLEAYRAYLAKEYRAIAALNACWHTHFTSFADVAPIGDNDETAALRAKNYPRWYDRQAFQRDNLVQYCQQHATAFRGIDPQAWTGFEGASGPGIGMGGDIEAIVRRMDFFAPYASPTDELIRSIAPRTLVRGNWIGYEKHVNGLLDSYWRTLTRGADSIWWWMCQSVGNYHGFLAPDLAPYAATRDVLNDTRIVREGLGDLLLHTPRVDDRIALLYSMPSEAASGLETGSSYGMKTEPGNVQNYSDEHTAWQQVIWDNGLQFHYITDRMLRATPLDARQTRVLILPREEALGTEAMQTIRAFVQAGGTVIADVRPALYSEHCQPRATGALDDLFGISRQSAPAATVSDLHIDAQLDGQPLALTWSIKNAKIAGGKAYGALCDPGVALTTGVACGHAGTTPLCVINRVGKGRAILLNFALASCFPQENGYALGSSAATPEPIATFIAQLLAGAGVAPQLRLQDALGKPVRRVEIIRWQNGASTLLALYPHAWRRQTAHLLLSHPCEVYNLRTGAACGHTADLEVEINPASPTWLALQPTPAAAISLTLKQRQVTPGTLVQASVILPGAEEQHALHLRLITPSGQPADWGEQVVLAGATPVTLDIPTAYNDPPGTWQVQVNDLLGSKASIDLQLTGSRETGR